MSTNDAPRQRSLLGALIVTPLKMLWMAAVILTPVLGFWLASSLATYLNGPVWLSGLAGALLFPILPLMWEWRGAAKYARRDNPKPRILTFLDRLTLRTLAINLVFLGSLLATFPQASFLALSTRGDWMLEGVEGAEPARQALFTTAESLEFVYKLSTDNPYEKFDDGSADGVTPKPTEDTRKRVIKPTTPDAPVAKREAGQPPAWPMPEKMHPLIGKIPASEQVSIERVSKYIASKESDPFLRVKAMHDYVVDRLSYDHDRLRRRDLTLESQQPDVVFSSKLAVCSGYSKLLVEMGKHTGDRIVYLTGDTREENGEQSDVGHAWNAVMIEGTWYFMDATWNDPTNKEDPSKPIYRTVYLFTPAHIFGLSHFPDKVQWQLRRDTLTRGEFLRQPLLEPEFYTTGLELKDPKRSQITVSSRDFKMTLKNPRGVRVLTRLAVSDVAGSADGSNCDVTGSDVITITCHAKAAGTYHVKLFAGPKGLRSYPHVGHFEVHVP